MKFRQKLFWIFFFLWYGIWALKTLNRSRAWEWVWQVQRLKRATAVEVCQVLAAASHLPVQLRQKSSMTCDVALVLHSSRSYDNCESSSVHLGYIFRMLQPLIKTVTLCPILNIYSHNSQNCSFYSSSAPKLSRVADLDNITREQEHWKE